MTQKMNPVDNGVEPGIRVQEYGHQADIAKFRATITGMLHGLRKDFPKGCTCLWYPSGTGKPHLVTVKSEPMASIDDQWNLMITMHVLPEGQNEKLLSVYIENLATVYIP